MEKSDEYVEMNSPFDFDNIEEYKDSFLEFDCYQKDSDIESYTLYKGANVVHFSIQRPEENEIFQEIQLHDILSDNIRWMTVFEFLHWSNENLEKAPVPIWRIYEYKSEECKKDLEALKK